MENIEDFHISYWGPSEIEYSHKKNGRSIKRKLAIVLCFLFILAMLPLFTVGYSKFKNIQTEKVSEAIVPVTPTPKPTIEPTPTTRVTINTDIIIKGDNYWKIAKRNCGSGKFYLSVQQANGAKPLQPGDTVIISCSL